MMKELTMTVATLAARSAEPSYAGSNASQKADPAGDNGGNADAEFFNIVGEGDKKHEDKTTSENTKLENPLENLYLKSESSEKGSAEANSVQFSAFPSSAQLQIWKTFFMYRVAAAAKDPRNAFQWASDIDQTESADDLAEDGCMHKVKHVSLESKTATGLWSILHGEFKRKVTLRNQSYAMMEPPRMSTGRGIVKMIFEHNKIIEAVSKT